MHASQIQVNKVKNRENNGENVVVITKLCHESCSTVHGIQPNGENV